MQNEFEKQVQQKMEELKLIPSQPVWEKVEMQIRKEKGRRRLFFLLPLFLVLIAGGIWMGTKNNPSTNSLQKKENKEAVDRSTQINSNKPAIKINTGKAAPGTTFNQAAITRQKKESKLHNQSIRLESALSYYNQKQKSQRGALSVVMENKQGFQQETGKINNHDPGRDPERNTAFFHEGNNRKSDSLKVAGPDTVTKFSVPDSLKSGRKDEDTTQKNQLQTNPTSLDSSKTNKAAIDSITAPVLKKQSKAKWKYALVANVGTSGLGRLNFYNGEKSLAGQLSSAGPGGFVYSGPSSVKKGLSFSIGLLKQKQVEKNLSFTVGLQYYYFSNSILVGNKVQRDTVFRNTYAVSQYFSNNGSSYSIALESYRNHYHFISVPIAIDWQMFKNFPLNWHGGFSLQQMIQTNALIFDYSSQAYYHSNKAFNKTQLFTEYGLSYSIPLKKQILSVGPQLQYALTSVEKNNSQHHLFSYELKAQLQLNKK